MRDLSPWIAVIIGGLVAALIVSATENSLRILYTTPAYDAVPGGCLPGSTPVTDLAIVELWGRWETGDTLLLGWHLAAAPGAPDSFVIPRVYQLHRVWVRAVDSTGNPACDSNAYDLWPPTSVPQEQAAAALPVGKRELFDIAGRRILGPPRSGIYFERIGGSKLMRVVVIR